MAITQIKIHPAIGIARLGNSPDDFFIGPEHPWERPNPQGGFKDADCRVKRQAARFRLFAYHDDGSIDEITAAEADITWEVHLANKKAISRNSGSDVNLTIDPGSRALDGPNQIKAFDNGQIKFSGEAAITVPLGEARTDDDGYLLVLGGFGKSASPNNTGIGSFYDNTNWYDDISDGPVTAHIRLHSTDDEFDAVGAWVIVAPPNFAPQLTNIITLQDRIFQIAVDQGWLTPPAVPSYTNDIYPILNRGRETQWVRNVSGAHSWAEPVYNAASRQAIFNRLKTPSGGGGNMPTLSGADGILTASQYEMMEKWKDGNFTQDWVAVPMPSAQITPQGLDYAALENCVGGAFYPGIEAGGITAKPIINPTKYVGAADPMRLNHAVLSAGDMSQYMALPWQADFKACGTNWWPVPRPNNIIPEGDTSYVNWDRGVDDMLMMVSEWHNLGFIVEQGNQFVEIDRCDMTFITLITPHLNYQDVPQGPMGMSRKLALPIVFEVKSEGAPVTLEVLAGNGLSHPRLTNLNSSVTVGPTIGNQIETVRLWIIYETGAIGENISDQLTVSHQSSNRSWDISLTASTVGRKVAAVSLVLDRSGSMSEDRGDGQSKHQSLKEAASIFVDVMLEGDGVGIVRYNQNAQSLQNVTILGPADDIYDTSRVNTKNIINGTGLTPGGQTSIGDGIFEGRKLLNAAGAAYDLRSLVVLTDGKENNDRRIADVSDEINELTYAVGLGQAQNTSAPALQTISGNNGGYLLVTGAITGDNRFVLQKYFLQILAGISNAEIILDPQGELILGQEQRIPFQVSDADSGIDVILLTPYPQYIDFRIETPTGQIIEPWRAELAPRMIYMLSNGVTYYRLVLPTELLLNRFDHGGRWHAVLSIGKPRLKRPDRPDRDAADDLRLTHTGINRDSAYMMARVSQDNRIRTLPYSLLVHSYSNLSLQASLEQSGFDPGAEISLHASLSETGIPARLGSYVRAEITRPDESQFQVVLNESEAGQFTATFETSISGIYQCRVRASGQTRAGYSFQREQTLTAAVWRGGNYDADPKNGRDGSVIRWLDDRDKRICELLNCLITNRDLMTPEFEKRLRESGLNLEQIRRCLQVYCKKTNQRPLSEASLLEVLTGLIPSAANELRSNTSYGFEDIE